MSERRKKITNRLKNYFKDFNKWALLGVITLLLISFYSRLTNLFNLGFEFDTVQTQYTWAKNALELGYGPFWRDYLGFIDYLPGALLLGMIFASIGNFLNPILPGDAAQAFVTVMKFFNMFVDLGIAIVCYYIARLYAKSSKEKSAFIASLCFALPSFWFISNVWGQFDSLVVFIALLSVIMIYWRNKFGGNNNIFKDLAFWSGILFAIGFWLKPLIILVVPILLIYQFSNKKAIVIKSAILSSLLWILIGSGFVLIGMYYYFNTANSSPILLVLAALFFGSITIYSYYISKKGNRPLISLYRQGLGFWSGSWLIAAIPVFYSPTRVAQMIALPYTKENVVSAGASTFWPLIGVEGDAGRKLFDLWNLGLSISAFGLAIFVIVMVAIYLRYQGIKPAEMISKRLKFNGALERLLERKLSFANFSILMTILGSAYFLFTTKVHSRYLIWSIVFSFVALAAISSKRGWKTWLIFVLIMHFGYFINQLGVFNAWYQYLPWTVEFLNAFNFDAGKLSSFCIFMGFLGFYLWTWRYSNPSSSLIHHIIN